MKVTPISLAGGAEISGVNLASSLDSDCIAAIRRAFHEYGVIVFRDQRLSDRDQLRFCDLLGGSARRGKPLEQRGSDDDSRYDGAVHMVTNVVRNGIPLGSFGDGEVWFHHDGSFREIPYAATVLYGIEIPSSGGETVFANMYLAYDRLPETVKQCVTGLCALNIYDYAATGRVDPDQDISAINHWIHPVVIRHPDTGRKALFVSPLMTARIETLTRQKSDDLLQELFRFIHDDTLIFEHRWRAGDVVMMDNRCMTHARRDFPSNERRMLRRTMIEGVALTA